MYNCIIIIIVVVVVVIYIIYQKRENSLFVKLMSSTNLPKLEQYPKMSLYKEREREGEFKSGI